MVKALIILCIIAFIINLILVIIDYSKGIQKQKKFTCKYCGRHFYYWEYLIEHMKEKHMEKIERESTNET